MATFGESDSRNLKEALKLLKWAADDFEKHKISNDNWYGAYEELLHYDIKNQAPKQGDVPTSERGEEKSNIEQESVDDKGGA